MLGPADCSLSDEFAAIAASASFAASASSDVRLLVMGDPAGELAALTLALTLPSRGSPLADLLRPDLFPPPLTPMLPMLLSMLLLALLIIPEGERSMDDPPALGGAVPDRLLVINAACKADAGGHWRAFLEALESRGYKAGFDAVRWPVEHIPALIAEIF